MGTFYHSLCLAIFLESALCQPWQPSPTSCPSLDNSSVPDNLYIDIFHEVTANYQGILSQLSMAPFINGMDPDLPAFEFVGMGSGFLLANLSSEIRRASCLHKEVTFSGLVYIRNSASDGPLLEIAYASGLEAGRPVYIINMDAGANEITVAFRHGGKLYSEVIPVRLISGKWRRYSITLSGNQLSFYFDCQLQFQRLVPLPDYCYDHAPLVVGVLSSVYNGVEYVGHSGLMVYVQSLSIEFGPGGNKRVCPSADARCPSCGQFLTYLERLTEAQEKVKQLEAELASLQEMGVVNTSAVCSLEVGGVTQTFRHGEFLRNSTSICYCESGVSMCKNESGRGSCGDEASTEAPTAPVTRLESQPTAPSGPSCMLGSDRLYAGDFDSTFSAGTGMCTVVTCESSSFGHVTRQRMYSCSSSEYTNCPSSLTKLQKEVASCCGICAPCDFLSCVGNEVCLTTDDIARCECRSGFVRNATNDCIDDNECERVECMEFSTCVNTLGAFSCECFPGYERRLSPDGSITCVDINECRMNTHNCSVNSDCTNTKSGFTCECHEGYIAGQYPGECTPTCSPSCRNGGICVAPNNCSCPPEYQGRICQRDVNECKTPGRCPGGQNCVNTVGGYFCRCDRGYSLAGSKCVDIDECRLNIDNCKGNRAKCFNTEGGYYCTCSDLGPGNKQCTGSCVRRGMRVLDTMSVVEKCRNCTCLAGEFSCVPVTCNCSNRGSWPEGCCHECERRDCSLEHNGETVLIRPGSTWIDPANRCLRFDCSQDLQVTHVNVSDNCPRLDCPEQTVPMGKCCPVCLLPKCDLAVQGETVSVHNGCRIYTCLNSEWSLTVDKTCSSASTCAPEDVVFFRDGCCPVCRQDILGSTVTQCSS